MRFFSTLGNSRTHLIKGASGTFTLKITAAGLGFLTTLLLARVLGASEYGAYVYAMAWVGVLGIPATLGFQQLLVRDVAIYHAKEQWGLLHGLLRFSNRLVLALSMILMVIAALIGWLLFYSKESNLMLYVFWVALLALPFSALTQLRQAAMRGFQQATLGQLPEMLIRPILFLILFLFAVFLFRQQLSAHLSMALNLIAVIISFMFGLYWLNRVQPQEIKAAMPQIDLRAWLSGAFPLLVVGGMYVINAQTDTIMLGAILGAREAGIYAIIKKLVDLIALVLMSVNTIIAPTIARYYAEGEMKNLQKLVTVSTRIIFFTTLPIAITLILYNDQVLSVFGDEFTQGKDALIILCLAQIINALMGSVSIILIMTKHEREAAVGIGIAVSVNILLNTFLIPLWGVSGAATATAISIIIWNMILAIKVHQRLGVITTVFAK